MRVLRFSWASVAYTNIDKVDLESQEGGGEWCMYVVEDGEGERPTKSGGGKAAHSSMWSTNKGSKQGLGLPGDWVAYSRTKCGDSVSAARGGVVWLARSQHDQVVEVC